MKKWMVIVLSLIAVLNIAQYGLPLPQNPLGPIPMEKYPIPGWARLGTVLVYRVEGGLSTVGEGGGSAFHSTGYMIVIITDVDDKEAYGITIIYYTEPDIMLTSPQVSPLNGMVFINPEQVLKILARKGEYAKDGIAVSGGKDQNGYSLIISYKTTTTMVVIDEGGKILYYSYKDATLDSSQVVIARFLKALTVNWPELSFPQIAKSSHVYNLSFYSGITGVTSPVGTSEIEYIKTEGRVAYYNQTISTYDSLGTPITQTLKVLGVPSYGPFYIHPSLLKLETIVNIPEINFIWYNTHSETGYGRDSVIEINGMEVMRISLTEEGFTTRIVQYIMGNYVIGELQM